MYLYLKNTHKFVYFFLVQINISPVQSNGQ